MEQEIKNGTYTIPEGFTAKIEDGKIVVEKKESDDEKINRAIFKALSKKEARDVLRDEHIEVSDALAYLEKQKEQQPAILNKEDDAITKQFVLNQLFSLKEHINFGRSWEYIPLIDGLIKAISESIAVVTPNEELLSQKPAEWSEEDEKMLIGIVERGDSEIPRGECGLTPNQVAWLETRFKSLRPRSHWKPSEEQMRELDVAVRGFTTTYPEILESLYNDLKKQM